MPRGLLLCDDLLFTSKVLGTARALGLEVKAARDPQGLLALARREPPSGVLIDLHNPGLDLPAFLAELKALCRVPPRLVAYGSHVEAATLHAARQAGCDLVLPRSRFVEDLPAALPAWLGGAELAGGRGSCRAGPEGSGGASPSQSPPSEAAG
jgi:DNA-binding NarL/FixJ family response regulator